MAAAMTSHTEGGVNPAAQGPCWAKVPVVKEELLSCLDGSLGEDTDPVVSVHHHDCNQRCNIRGVQPQLGPELSQR